MTPTYSVLHMYFEHDLFKNVYLSLKKQYRITTWNIVFSEVIKSLLHCPDLEVQGVVQNSNTKMLYVASDRQAGVRISNGFKLLRVLVSN